MKAVLSLALASVLALSGAQMRPFRGGKPPALNAGPAVFSAQMSKDPGNLLDSLMKGTLRRKPLPPSQIRALGVGKSVLVLYDAGGPYGYIGNGLARMLATWLTHFKTSTTILPVEQYLSGMMASNDATFYIGNTYDNALPAGFKSDAMSTSKPLCWMGYNLWKIAWKPDYSGNNPAFISRFGFTFNYLDTTPWATVRYNGYVLKPDVWNYGQANVTINATKAKVRAKYVNADGTASMPYIIRSNNFWYVGDDPLLDSSTNLSADRSLAFQDIIHDMLQTGATESHKAVVRIEDVHAYADPGNLRDLADVLYAQGVPFVVSVIPRYRDPLGFYTGGDPVDETIMDHPDVVAALKYMESKGGQIIMHGYTHQYDSVQNPYSGVTGEDYEFYRFAVDPYNPGNDVPYGPVFEDSASWVNDRIQQGLNVLAAAGFQPTGWNTPHYFASLLDYVEIAKRFKFSMDRGKVFTADGYGNAYMLDEMVNWPVVDDLGMVRIPENLGFVSNRRYGFPGQNAGHLVRVSKNYKALRDGWVGCYFHPFLAPRALKTLVVGLKGNGYQFVMPSETLVN